MHSKDNGKSVPDRELTYDVNEDLKARFYNEDKGMLDRLVKLLNDFFKEGYEEYNTTRAEEEKVPIPTFCTLKHEVPSIPLEFSKCIGEFVNKAFFVEFNSDNHFFFGHLPKILHDAGITGMTVVVGRYMLDNILIQNNDDDWTCVYSMKWQQEDEII